MGLTNAYEKLYSYLESQMKISIAKAKTISHIKTKADWVYNCLSLDLTSPVILDAWCYVLGDDFSADEVADLITEYLDKEGYKTI